MQYEKISSKETRENLEFLYKKTFDKELDSDVELIDIPKKELDKMILRILHDGILRIRNKSFRNQNCTNESDSLHNLPRFVLSEEFSKPFVSKEFCLAELSVAIVSIYKS